MIVRECDWVGALSRRIGEVEVTCDMSGSAATKVLVPRSKGTSATLSLRSPLSTTMVKRGAEEAGLETSPDPKRIRPTSRDHLSRLSDELILRVLSYLPVSDLVVSQRCVPASAVFFTDC